MGLFEWNGDSELISFDYYINNVIAASRRKFNHAFMFKGSVKDKSCLDKVRLPKAGDIYHVIEEEKEYVFIENKWEEIDSDYIDNISVVENFSNTEEETKNEYEIPFNVSCSNHYSNTKNGYCLTFEPDPNPKKLRMIKHDEYVRKVIRILKDICVKIHASDLSVRTSHDTGTIEIVNYHNFTSN